LRMFIYSAAFVPRNFVLISCSGTSDTRAIEEDQDTQAWEVWVTGSKGPYADFQEQGFVSTLEIT
jgi:hypothetical protein